MIYIRSKEDATKHGFDVSKMRDDTLRKAVAEKMELAPLGTYVSMNQTGFVVYQMVRDREKVESAFSASPAVLDFLVNTNVHTDATYRDRGYGHADHVQLLGKMQDGKVVDIAAINITAMNFGF